MLAGGLVCWHCEFLNDIEITVIEPPLVMVSASRQQPRCSRSVLVGNIICLLAHSPTPCLPRTLLCRMQILIH